jgi:RNA 3'-terminal phosphate cyclase (ATP)
MLTIDGAIGEGGGQVLRTALALSVVTGTPFGMIRIRARREKRGLRPQHVAAVRAAAAVGDADVAGDAVGVQEIVFRPRRVRPGTHRFAVGTAGSATLVLQTVLPALLTAATPSRLTLEGGTHNPLAPPFDFLARTFLPLLERMGPGVAAVLERYGFYPAGGGCVTVGVRPAARLLPISVLERGALARLRARAVVARLSPRIAERELAAVRRLLDVRGDDAQPIVVTDGSGPGNAVLIDVESEHVTAVFSAVGERGVLAETVAERAARAARDYLDAGVPVDEHLADQLLLPLALAGGGAFRTTPLSLHAVTNMEVVRLFVPVAFRVEAAGSGVVVGITRSA